MSPNCPPYVLLGMNLASQKLVIHESKAFILLPSSSDAIFFTWVAVRARTTIWHDISGSKVLNNALSFKVKSQ